MVTHACTHCQVNYPTGCLHHTNAIYEKKYMFFMHKVVVPVGLVRGYVNILTLGGQCTECGSIDSLQKTERREEKKKKKKTRSTENADARLVASQREVTMKGIDRKTTCLARCSGGGCCQICGTLGCGHILTTSLV